MADSHKLLKYLQTNYPELEGLISVPELRRLLQRVMDGQLATPTAIRGALEGSKWYRSHNAQQRKWQVMTEADKNMAIETSKEGMAQRYDEIFGNLTAAPKMNNWWAEAIASGHRTLDQWVQRTRQSPAYQTLYAGNIAREKAGLLPLSEADYRQTLTDYQNVFRQYGIDPKQYDAPADFTNLFKNDVRPDEEAKRLDLYRQTKDLYGPRMRENFQKYAGLGNLSDSDLYGVVSRTRPDLEHVWNTATNSYAPPSEALLEEASKKAQAAQAAQFTGQGRIVAQQQASTASDRLEQTFT